ncbi:DUF501 domain-containing protein [Actinomyces sp. zg-332]|nr:DUF501 domain-containing protein [Actinomyces sp. zg-332]QPK94302.1 DUF501 domain-containing protein [Actinomyces sp. zg-332]
MNNQDTTVTSKDLAELERQLDRAPRGVEKIPARCVCGNPLTVMTSPRLEDGTPFPTVFYLTHPGAVRACSVLEAEKFMETMNDTLQNDIELQKKYSKAHENYIAQREQLGEVPEIKNVSAGGMPTRIKCLHALLGHTLSVGRGINPIGDWVLDVITERNLWNESECFCKKENE